jgi:DNA (cytosine-5)-methyltransferase 1
MIKDKNFTFIDLFAGIGGFRLAFERERLAWEKEPFPFSCECVFSSEIDRFANLTYQANFNESALNDITEMEASEIPDHDLLLAGFPCQPFSNAGRKEGLFDTRGTLFFDIQRILLTKKPKAFILENVKQLKSNDSGNTLRTIESILTGNINEPLPRNLPLSDKSKQSINGKLNYAISTKVLSAHEYGRPNPVPQKRERIFIIGFREDQKNETSAMDFFKWPKKKKLTKKINSILEKKSGEYFKDFQISARLWESHKKRKERNKKLGKGFGYTRFNKEDPYTRTLSARYYKDGSEILIDQELGEDIPPRMLTPRECANLQGFPKDFVLPLNVSKLQLYKQFGNSVPVPLVRSIAFEVLSALSDFEDSIHDKK